MKKSTFDKIQKQLRKWDPDWGKTAKQHYCSDYFDIYAFLMGFSRPTISTDFRGADVIASINDKLLNHYGWGILNSRLPFDYYILKLEKLVVHTNSTDGHILVEYDGKRFTIPAGELDNVPVPLVAITQFFTQLKSEMASDISQCPLKCSLYEQL